MKDITKQQIHHPSLPWKEHIVNLIAGLIPSTLVISLLKVFGFSGVFISLALLFGFAYLIGKIRNKHKIKTGKNATWKTIGFWVLINILFYISILIILSFTI